MSDAPEKLEHPLGKRVNTSSKQPLRNVELGIRHARVVAQTVVKEPLSKKATMLAAGYAPSTAAKQVARTFKGKSFNAILEELMPDSVILEQHESLMKSRRLDHMVFPVNLEDEEIGVMLADVNCVLRKVVHGDQAKHAYFWSPDNKARKDALDMLYKLKGKYAPEKFEDVSDYNNLTTAELLERKKAALAFYKKKSK